MHITMERPAQSFTGLTIVIAVHLALLAGLLFGLETVRITLPHEKDVTLTPIPPDPVKPIITESTTIPVNIITMPIPQVLPPPEYIPETIYVIPGQPTILPGPPILHLPPVASTEKPADVFNAAIVDARSCDKPAYPPSALRNEQTGVVTLELLIGLDGKVADSKIAKSSGHRELDQAAIAGLSLCKFKPATLNGQPQKSWAKLQYAWNLDS